MSEAVESAVLVTGAGRRLGQLLALHIGSVGLPVVAHWSSSADGARETVRTIRSAGGAAWDVQADLLDFDASDRLLAAAEAAAGMPIHHVVHAAALFEFDTAQDFTEASWDRHFGLNARAGVLLARSLAARLGPEGRGSAVFILDGKLWNLNPDFFTYTLSKGALLTAKDVLARALAPVLRVNAVAPGYTLPNPGESEERFRDYGATLPLGSTADPAEIARAVLFFLTSRTVTGQTVIVDGGEHLVPLARDPMYRDDAP